MTVQLLKPGAKVLFRDEPATLVATFAGGSISRVKLHRRRAPVIRRPAHESTPSTIILDTSSANVTTDARPPLRCSDCQQTLGWYGHNGVGYLHMRTSVKDYGQFYGTSHAVPAHQRHNPAN